jgi:hypothetical protein
MNDATFTSSDSAAMNRLILVLLLMMIVTMIVMMMVIHSLLRKEGSIHGAVCKELLVVSQRLLDAQLRLLDGGEKGQVMVKVSSSEASNQQLMDNAAAVMKKKAAAAAKKKRNKRNKAAAKQNCKRGTKRIVWLGDGIIPRIMMVVVGSITTFIFALSLIHQSDGSGDVKAPPALRPSTIISLRQRDLQSSSSMPSTPPNTNIMSPSPIPVVAQPPTPIFSPTATERNALSDFYDSAGGPEWTDRTNWLDESTSYCDWKGVICDDDGHVRQLHLHNNGLSGRLSESIGNLAFIEVLDLSNNAIKVIPLGAAQLIILFAFVFIANSHQTSTPFSYSTNRDRFRLRLASFQILSTWT